MTARREKIKKMAGWFSVILLGLVLITIIIAGIRFPQFAIKKLTDFTEKKSEGQYSLSIGEMKWKLFPFSVRFSQLLLTPDEAATIAENLHSKTLFTLGASDIVMEGIKLRALLRDKKFSCQKMRIVKPDIEMEGEELLQSDSLKMAAGIVSQIRPLFDWVREVDIRKIEMEEADFDLYGAAGKANFISRTEKVSIDVLGFRTDTAMILRDDHFFETDDVFIRMNDFRNEMGDSLHVLTIDTLLYSLKTSVIRVAGFNLSPLSRTTGNNLFEVTVPNVYVKSRSITRFALNDSIKISFLEFDNPEIQFFQKENPDRLNPEDFDNFDLYTLVQNHFRKLEVDTFLLRGAHLKIFRQPDYQDYRQQFESINITLEGFVLDSTSAANPEKLLHSDNLEMKVNGYHLRLEDDEHHFRADSLFVSTFSDRLSAKEIHIHPENIKETTTRTEVNIECKALNIEEVDLRNVYQTRTLPTSRIEVIEPDVDLLYHLEKVKRKKQVDAGLLFELVTDYLRGVYANLVYINDGRLDIKNSYRGNVQGYFETRFDFSLTDFSLDSASLKRTDKFFYATNFDLHFSDYQMRLIDDLHRLRVKNVSVSSTNQRVQIENLDLQPVIDDVSLLDMQRFNRSELFHISIPKINLSGVSLRDAFFHKKLHISRFSISNPDIYFENFGVLRAGKKKVEITEFYQLIFNYLEDFDIKHFTVPDGKLTWVNHTRRGRTTSFDNEFSASLENFRLNKEELGKERLLFSDNFDVTIKDQEFELSDNVHVLKGSEIRLSSAQSSVRVKDALLYPLITSEKYHELATTFQVAIPELKIEGFDFQKAWHSQEPEIKKLELLSPRFQIYTQEGMAKPLDLNAYRFPLPSFVESLRLNELKITDGEAITHQTRGIDHHPQARFLFDFSMPGILVKNNAQNQVQLTSNNIQLTVSDFRAPIDRDHNLTIERIDFDRTQKSIAISNLKVNPLLPRAKQNRFSITAPTIHLSEFDLDAVLNDNSFALKNIDIDNPKISIEINRQVNDDTLEFLQTLDLYPYVEHVVNQIKVDHLRLSNADLHFNWLEKQFFNQKINIGFSDILIGENQPPANLLNSREFEISTTHLATKSKDGLYQFSADSFIYNSARHQVLLKSIGIIPLIEPESFPLQKGFQTDVAKAHISFIELKNLNEKRWLQENILDAAALKIGPGKISIFRNKRYPLDPDQRPPWPQDLLKQIEQPFIFDSVILRPTNLTYSELMGITDEPGTIEFNNLAFNGGRLSNIKKVLQQNSNFTLDARAQLLGQSLLSVRFSFDLNSPEYAHTAKGFLQPMSLVPLNSMISTSAPLAIEEGQLNQLEFELSFNETQADGFLYFDYDNLKIAVLDYSNDKIQKAKFASFLANKMAFNSQSPKNDKLYPVEISYVRDEQRSVLNYWWKSIYSGAKKVLGLEEPE